MTIEYLGLKAMGSCNPRALRSLLGQFATGVTVITACASDGRKLGLTVNSFSSVSLAPALILWSLARSSPNLEDFRAAGHFAVHILGHDQHEISSHFARPAPDKFLAVPHHRGPAGLPLLDNALATLVCRNRVQHDGGDHLIFLGEIEHYRQGHGEPLVFHGGRYRIAGAHPALG